MKSHHFLPIIFPLFCIANAKAAISYATAGTTYTENFDRPAFTLADETGGTWTNDSTIPGWYWINTSGTTPSTFLATDVDGPRQGQILSLGTPGGTDRAFGHQSTNAISTIRYGVQILNVTGSTLDSFTLSYKGEQWRRPTGQSVETLAFEYQIFAAGTANPLAVTTGWTSVASLDFAAPNTAGASTNLDGNATGNFTLLSGGASGINWGAGQELWLRWTDLGESSSRLAALGVDDINFSAVPEPSFAFMGGIAALGLILRRR